MSLVRLNPALSLLGRWPEIWNEDEFPTLSTTNQLDVYETADSVVVKANVAGVPADKVDTTFERGVLWIRAEAEQQNQEEKRKHYSSSSWSYSYKVAVPGDIDYSHEPQAEISHGVITVTFKKAEASKPKKLTVKVKAE